MFAALCRRRPISWAPKNAVFFSSETCPSSVCENVSEKSFTVSYLVNSCGLSSEAAISASKKLCLKSSKKPDAVLKLLRGYGFTDAHIPRLVTGWPNILSTRSPEATLLPKLEFFCSIGVPRPVLAHMLSGQPYVLTRSLENLIIPLYNNLKGLLQSDERVVRVFSRAPNNFKYSSAQVVSSNISMLRGRGMPESYIVSLVLREPVLMLTSNKRLSACIFRALNMGFDVSKCSFFLAIRVFAGISKSTMKHKMEVFRRCGWSESDISAAFLRYPLCMTLSEQKIMVNMEFLVNEFGCQLADIARCPVVLNFSLEKRIKPRCMVVRILNDKGLKKKTSVINPLLLVEGTFLKRYVVKYEKEIPELLDIYRGKIKSARN